jgi:hypothetical protein
MFMDNSLSIELFKSLIENGFLIYPEAPASIKDVILLQGSPLIRYMGIFGAIFFMFVKSLIPFLDLTTISVIPKSNSCCFNKFKPSW